MPEALSNGVFFNHSKTTIKPGAVKDKVIVNDQK